MVCSVCTSECKFNVLQVASWLNSPICNAREYLYGFYILDETTSTLCEKIQRIAFLSLGLVVSVVLAPFTTPWGLALRGLVSTLEEKPYIYIAQDRPGKTLPKSKEISIVGYNACLISAGYSISDGQVTPPSDRKRVDRNIEKLKSLDADILCLFEVADPCDAAYLCAKLPEYPFIIPVAGLRAIGPSSMMYIASKYRINRDSIFFEPFDKETEVTGRARYSEKGVLSFAIYSQGDDKPCAHIKTSHLQHSEIPSHPQEDEIVVRKIQTLKMLKPIPQIIEQKCPVIILGDLNQNEKEIESTLQEMPQLQLHRDQKGVPTWGGEDWGATLMKKQASKEEVLDYMFVAGEGTSISTQILQTGYEKDRFKVDALSDHCILYSKIRLGRTSWLPFFHQK